MGNYPVPRILHEKGSTPVTVSSSTRRITTSQRSLQTPNERLGTFPVVNMYGSTPSSRLNVLGCDGSKRENGTYVSYLGPGDTQGIGFSNRPCGFGHVIPINVCSFSMSQMWSNLSVFVSVYWDESYVISV